ncbi:MAG: hypothetical protein ACYCSR_00440 [Thiomonas sp.]|uniref:Carboxypeptidase regulatory-like domain-containing protein n=1 Tax=mine drainage metagenome TaxID=410659 RepID=E6PKW3_9ZZZZ
MKHLPTSVKCVALLAAALLPLAASQAHAATIHTQGSIQYVCSGVGQGSLQKMQAQAAKFNLGFWMVKGPQGEYLANVPVKVMQNGKTVAKFTAGGPLCYLKAPAGTYTIEGRHDGQLRTIQAQSGTTAHYLRW